MVGVTEELAQTVLASQLLEEAVLASLISLVVGLLLLVRLGTLLTLLGLSGGLLVGLFVILIGNFARLNLEVVNS